MILILQSFLNHLSQCSAHCEKIPRKKRFCHLQAKTTILLQFSQKIFLNINIGFIDILFFKNKKLAFYNSFDHETPEDILYYLLFCFSQLDLNPEEIHTTCSGNIDLNSKVYALLYKYVRNIDLFKIKEINGVDSNILKTNILLREF